MHIYHIYVLDSEAETDDDEEATHYVAHVRIFDDLLDIKYTLH